MVDREDYFIWRFNKSGDLTVKLVYWFVLFFKVKSKILEIFMESFIYCLKEKV